MAPLRSSVARLPLVGPAIFEMVRSLRYPQVESVVREDLAETRRTLGWLRAAITAAPAQGPTLLILSLSDMVYQLKLEAMLGAALRLQGWRVRVLTDSPANIRGRRYFDAFGLDDFVYLDAYPPTKAETAHAAEAARTLMAGTLDFPTVKAWSFEGSWIGPQILSAVSRTRHKAAPDPADPEIRRDIAAVLPETLARILVAERLVADVAPALGLVIEANDVLHGPFVDRVIASGAAVIQVTQPWRDDALILRRLTRATRRMHPSSVAPETLDTLARRPWTAHEDRALSALFADRYNGKWFLQARNQPDTRPTDRAALTAQFGLHAEHKIAVVFSHVLWDANLFYGEDLFDDYGDWFVATVRAAAANPHVEWLVKMHPANLWKRARDGVGGEFAEVELIRAKVGALPPHVHLVAPDSDIETLSLFQSADMGITVRGTSGMEMPCFGKPMLTAGTGRYSGLGFTIDSRSREEYLGRLSTLQNLPPMAEAETARALWHAYAAFVLRPWKMQSFRSEFEYQKSGVAPFDHNLIGIARSTAEADANGDLARFARWAAGSDVDYLETAPIA
jgi:hypothetical protein